MKEKHIFLTADGIKTIDDLYIEALNNGWFPDATPEKAMEYYIKFCIRQVAHTKNNEFGLNSFPSIRVIKDGKPTNVYKDLALFDLGETKQLYDYHTGRVKAHTKIIGQIERYALLRFGVDLTGKQLRIFDEHTEEVSAHV